MSTVELDNLAAETAAAMTTMHHEYDTLAARITVSNMHKETASTKQFSQLIEALYNYMDPKKKNCRSPLVSEKTYLVVQKYAKEIDSAIKHHNDYEFNYFGLKTLERSYLLRMNGKIAERPQQLFMRVAIGIHGDDITSVLDTYRLMSTKHFTHATPTLFNAGTPHPQLASCFLLSMKEDSIDGIFDTLKDCAKISKAAGGIGLAASHIRATGSYINGTGGTSNGIIPMIRVYNNTARYVDQGGNKRPGSFAIYLEPWHADIFDFIELRTNTGKDEIRARDIHLGLWVPDLFMKRVEMDGDWSLFCPDEAPGLCETWGDEFEVS